MVEGHLGMMKGTAAVFGERMAAPPLLLSLTGGPGQVATKGLVRGLGEVNLSGRVEGTTC